jgi:hypothetical protein
MVGEWERLKTQSGREREREREREPGGGGGDDKPPDAKRLLKVLYKV